MKRIFGITLITVMMVLRTGNVGNVTTQF
ncbi:uncharacterized protein METZ01_LOCUS421468 [marine metagenome]|uniref:Uncharacterized protein n=1 Tax=marine metagenome TaxID=408172 RepID=A0A382XCM4_9ZZZZ